MSATNGRCIPMRDSISNRVCTTSAPLRIDEINRVSPTSEVCLRPGARLSQSSALPPSSKEGHMDRDSNGFGNGNGGGLDRNDFVGWNRAPSP
jgi:hypothetical protein